ncbi:NucA/NucB deoxyribonuclease domain-containing protein [Amycolatopsis japonica]
MQSKVRELLGALTMSVIAAFAVPAPVTAQADAIADEYAGGTVSDLLRADGAVSTLRPEARNGTVEEARRYAARNHDNVADTNADELKNVDALQAQLATAAVEPPPEWLLNECLSRPGADGIGGHVLFRGYWCQKNKVHGEYIYNGKKEGEFTVEYRAQAVANPFTRQVHYWFHGDDYDTSGSFSGWSTLSLKVECVDLTVGCSADRKYVTMDVGDWDDGEWVNWNLSSDEAAATQQPEKVLRNLFVLRGSALDDFNRPVELDSLTRPGFRCDSADYFAGAPKACVFTDVIPRLNYEYGQGYNEVVDHIKLAHLNPGATHPPRPGKLIPGHWGGIPNSAGLNRVPYGLDTWTKNRNAKDAACRTLPPKQPGQECDEYPFATTVQGAGRGDGNFSVKYVNGGQNGLAGNALQTYLRWDRILYDEDPVADGTLDEYWVKAG